MWSALVAHGGGAVVEPKSLEEVREGLTTPKTVVWIDFVSATPDEVRAMTEMFALDPLTVEDCVADLHHPKIDDFAHYLYLVVHGVRGGSARGEMQTVELDVVVTKNALMTFRGDAMRSVEEVWAKAKGRPGFLAHGPAQALQAILAAQADHYVDEVETLHAEIHQLEEEIFAERKPKRLERRVFALKRDIAHLRQILGSQRELVHRIGRGDFPEIPARMRMVYRDVYDHLYRATELLDTLRELSMALLETHLAQVANHTNQVMRVLTTVATFILPLTLVTGWFGMNFRNLAGLGVAHPDAFVLAIFAVVSLAMGWVLARWGGLR